MTIEARLYNDHSTPTALVFELCPRFDTEAQSCTCEKDANGDPIGHPVHVWAVEQGEQKDGQGRPIGVQRDYSAREWRDRCLAESKAVVSLMTGPMRAGARHAAPLERGA